MTELCVDTLTPDHDMVLSPHHTYTLPRYSMSDVMSHVTTRDNQKSATLAKMEGNTEMKQEMPKLRRRPSIRGFSNFIDRMVRTVATLPRDKNSRKYETAKVDEGYEYVQYSPEETPGVVGLNNHGNTCFINAVLQCLSNTDVLAEYFVTGKYRADLCRRSRSNAKKFGTKGEVTEQLAMTLKSIWSRQYNSEISSQFKSYVEKYGSHFRGNEQHDAQEFLMWLLDKVHEDLNTATKRKYRKIKESLGRSDEVVAAETLANHLRCNASFVQDIFQAQFRSSLRCPSCRKESNTFDPFLCVSVPILQRQIRPLIVTLVYANQQPRQVRMGFSVESGSTVADLKGVIGADTGLEPGRLLMCQLDDTGFSQILSDAEAVWSIGDTEKLYCIELPPDGQLCEEDALVTLVWTNLRLTEAGAPHRFGSPYVMQVSRDVLYVDLQKLLLKEMASIVKPNVLSTAQQVPLFTIRVVDSIPVDHTVQHPLFTEPVEEALSTSLGQPHVALLLEWEQEAIDSVLTTTEDYVEEHRTVREVSRQSLSPVTLQECLQLYTKTERLGPEDSWRCPSCQSSQQAEKRLSLWSIPDILVIHLKRFRQTNNQRSTSKLTTMVEFPLHSLDMGQHVAARHGPGDGHGSHLSLLNVWSPWKRHQRAGASAGRPGVYELYGVCNHHGKDLQSGHYTALCKNATDGNWYNYDDARVQRIEEAAVVTPDAYILFYQRCSLAASVTESAAQGAHHASCHNNEQQQQHWAYRIPVRAPGKKSNLSSAATSPSHNAAATAVTSKQTEVSATAASAVTGATVVTASSKTNDATTANGAAAMQGCATRLNRGGRYSTLPPGRSSERLASQVEPPCSDDEAPLASEEMVELEGGLTPLVRPRHISSASVTSAHSLANGRPVAATGSGSLRPPPTANGRPASVDVITSAPALTNGRPASIGAVTSAPSLTNGQPASYRGASPQPDLDERMPSRPQVIVIGKSSSNKYVNGDPTVYGDRIQIFVADPIASGDAAAKLKLTKSSLDGSVQKLSNGRLSPTAIGAASESRL